MKVQFQLRPRSNLPRLAIEWWDPMGHLPIKSGITLRHFEIGYSFWLISLHVCWSMIFCKLFSYMFYSIVWQKQFEFPWTWRFFLNLNLTSPNADEAWTVFHAHWKPVIHPLLETRKATCCWGPCLRGCACWFQTSQWDAVVCFWWLWRSSFYSLDMF